VKDALGRVQAVLVLGGGSDIARATLHRLLDDGPLTAILAAREPERLETEDLTARGATVACVAFDAAEPATHAGVIESAFANGDVDVVLVAFGVLGSQTELEADPDALVELVRTNVVGGYSALAHSVARLRTQGHGTVVLLSSIAGRRARRSNYAYGSTKAAVDELAQGIQLSLAGESVRLIIVRPGFVHSKMTEGLRPAPFATTPADVAEAIVRSLRENVSVVWVPPVLRAVSAVLRMLPTRALQRL
jgi:decaprenylphospho-beta-D-erythro-pentofuranosid-2-ulose 2-reductase